MNRSVATGGNQSHPAVPLRTIAREWVRLGCIGFGGPPTHIALLRRLCVIDRSWITADEFEDGVAATNLLPGPASTQLAIFCAWRLAGTAGGIVGGIGFIVPGLVLILALSALFLEANPPTWILGAAAGAGAIVPAIALHAASGFVPASWQRTGSSTPQRSRWIAYALCGGIAAATLGPYLAAVLVLCGGVEIVVRRSTSRRSGPRTRPVLLFAATHAPVLGGSAALVWVALKVGLLSYGGGFVIVPLMQHDAVSTYHWMTSAQFLSAVALGQVTPGPVVLTTAVVGYAAMGVAGGLLAAVVAFTPSFLFVLAGGSHFDRLRSNPDVRSFLIGAGPAVIGAIAGSAIPLGRSFVHLWQIPLLALGLIWLFVARRSVVAGLLIAAACGAGVALAGVAVR